MCVPYERHTERQGFHFGWIGYFYDGQMPAEEWFFADAQPNDFTQVIRYGLGARGIDYIERVRSTPTPLVGFPVYDGHGNMIATLARSGTSYSVNDERSYDAWGGVRTGNTTGEPNARYCANLGHLQDDESGRIYMRARYYEPGRGRFISQDPAQQGWNLFTYCGNDPMNRFDSSGRGGSC